MERYDCPGTYIEVKESDFAAHIVSIWEKFGEDTSDKDGIVDDREVQVRISGPSQLTSSR